MATRVGSFFPLRFIVCRSSRPSIEGELIRRQVSLFIKSKLRAAILSLMKVGLFALLLLACPAVDGQRILSEFTGVVRDPSGGAVVDARVTAIEEGTLRKWSTTTNEAGIYRLGSLPPGNRYELVVEANGFKIIRQAGVSLDAADVRRVDFTVEVGLVAESVTVQDVENPLNLERSEVGAVVSRRAVVDLPLNGRSVYQLAELQPGVVRVAGTGLQESETTSARVGAAGSRFRDNQILLDGVTNNNDRQGGRTTMNLSPDAIEQFRIVTNNLSAEFGRSAGAVISVISRGGTNKHHGTAFWFLRNDNLDASNTFEARAGRQPEFKQNQFGATIGGPVAKSRLFYFGSYQGLRLRQPVLRQFTVETPQFRDFVARTRPNSIAARLLRDFPPLANPNLNVRDIGSPAPGVLVAGPPDGIPDLGEVFVPIRGFTNDDQVSLRFDGSFNEGRDTVTFRYSWLDQARQSASSNSVRAFVEDTRELDQNLGFNHTHVFSPHVINELRLGYNFDPQYTDGNYPEIPFISMSVAGRSVAFSSSAGFVFPLDIRTNTYQFYDSLSVNNGRHGVKLGFEFRRFQENSEFPTFLKPQATFNDLLDFADDEVLTLIARVNPATGRPTGTYRNFRQSEWGFFVQDDWKITPRLTLNLGIRYESFGSLGEKNGLLATLAPAPGNPAAGRIGRVDRLYQSDDNNWAPRVGLAWDPTGAGKWAIRGGSGVFFSRIWSNFTGNTRFNPPDSLQVTLDARTPGQNPQTAYRIPFVGDPAFARQLDANGGNPTIRPAAQTVDPGLAAPYNIHWFLGVQRRLPWQMAGEVNYIGNAGRKLLIRNEINRFSGDLADGRLDRVNPSFASITHGYNAVSSNYNALTAQLNRRFASGFSAQIAYTFSRSIDTDSEPFGGGPGEQLGSLDVNNLRLERGLSAFDAAHRLAGSFIWELPFFRSQKGVVSAILGGWQMNGILSLQSGFPFSVVTGSDYNLDGILTDRPNAITAIPRVVGAGPRAFSDGAFGSPESWTNLFRPAPAGATPNLGRNTFRGAGFATADASLFKELRLVKFGAENLRLQFRTEFFNLTNRVNLRNVQNSLGTFNVTTQRWSNAVFGRTTQAFEGRQIQFALKVLF